MLLRLRACTAIMTMMTTITIRSSTLPPAALPMMMYWVGTCWRAEGTIGPTVGGTDLGRISEERKKMKKNSIEVFNHTNMIR